MALIGPIALLALAAAVCFALQAVTIDYGISKAREALDIAPVLAAAIITVIVSATLFWLIAVVRGLPVEEMTMVSLAPFAIAGLAYPGIFRLLFFGGIDRVGPSVAGAIVAANPAIAALTAAVGLGERLTLLSGLGIICIVIGAALLQLARNAAQEGTEITDLISRQVADASAVDMLYPAGAAVLAGAAFTTFKFGLDRFPYPSTATAVAQSAGLVLFLGLLAVSVDVRSEFRDSLSHYPALLAFVLAGVIVAAGWLSQFFALREGTVVVVVPLISTYPLLIVALSYGRARELPRSPRIIAGIVAVVAGASLVQVF